MQIRGSCFGVTHARSSQLKAVELPEGSVEGRGRHEGRQLSDTQSPNLYVFRSSCHRIIAEDLSSPTCVGPLQDESAA